MVCVPCIIIPFCLFIWHKFLQPIFLRFWNPFGQVEEPKKDEAVADATTTADKTDKPDVEGKTVNETSEEINSHKKSD
jgi:hypothetical protein